MGSPEKLTGPEVNYDAVSEAAERQKEHLKSAEHESPHENQAESAEKARTEALHEASTEEEYRQTSKSEHDDQPIPHEPVTKKRLSKSYNDTMNIVQQDMPLTSRVFSKIIHNPIIEKTSDVVGSTIFRPNAILSGSVFAFLSVLGLYLLARHMGFRLQGFETIGAFIAGWVLGVVFDFLKALISRKP